jgi:predicted nuclease with TOPRIM domain
MEGRKVDIEAVTALVEALERDLAKVRAGSGDVEALRREVDALKGVLDADEPHHEGVRERLHEVRGSLESTKDTLWEDAVVGSDYISRIGRMLGM